MIFCYLFEIFWPQLAGPFDFHRPEALLVDIGYIHLASSLDVIRGKILTIVTDNDRLDQSGRAFRVFLQYLDLIVVRIIVCSHCGRKYAAVGELSGPVLRN